MSKGSGSLPLTADADAFDRARRRARKMANHGLEFVFNVSTLAALPGIMADLPSAVYVESGNAINASLT